MSVLLGQQPFRTAHPRTEERPFGTRLRVACLYVGRLLGVALLLGTLILVGGLTQLSLNDYLHPIRSHADTTPASLGLAYQEAPLVTEDGLNLSAWYIPGSRTASLILVHGLGGNRGDELELAADLHARGYTLLLPDLRAHGSSQGDTSTLGVREVRDIRAAVAYLQAQPGLDPDRIGIYGGSLGGAVALLAAGAMPQLQAVVADSTFSSARWVIDHQLHTLLNLPDWFGPLLLAAGSLEAGISPDEAAPATAAAHLGQRPLLVIHGTADATFEVDNARLIDAAASGPHELWILDGVGHVGAYGHDRTTFVDRLDEFFTAALGPA